MNRNHSIDAIRGMLLVLMTLNHFMWNMQAQSILQLFTLQPLGQVSAAEGFIFISGLMVGLVYARKSFDIAKSKILTRTFQIYRYHFLALALGFGIAWVVVQLNPDWIGLLHFIFPFLYNSPVEAVAWSIPLIHKAPYYDILPMYVAFMLAAPWVIKQLNAGRIAVVIALSVALWLLSDYIVLKDLLTKAGATDSINTGFFSWLAWQLPFFAGVALGFYKDKIQWFANKLVTAVVALIAVVLFLAHHNFFVEYGIHQGVLFNYADKAYIGWLRLLNLAVLVYLFGFIVSVRPSWLSIRPLALLGRHSLQVFTCHYVVIMALPPLVAMLPSINGLFEVAVLASCFVLFVPALWRERQKVKAFKFSQMSKRSVAYTMSLPVLAALTIYLSQEEPLPEIASDSSYDLTVEIAQYKQSGGTVLAQLFTESDQQGQFGMVKVSDLENNQASGIVFENLPGGYYALRVFQDLDGNQELNLDGFMPLEPLGFSNDPVLQGPPEFKDIRFAVDQAKTVKVTLVHYN